MSISKRQIVRALRKARMAKDSEIDIDQGVIDPRDTRKVLSFTLKTCSEAKERKLKPNSFGVARM